MASPAHSQDATRTSIFCLPTSRTRKQRGKSREGCTQCKASHRKCDLAQPHCGLCARKGLQCSGYERKIRWSSKHERFRRADSNANAHTWEVARVRGGNVAASDSGRSPGTNSHAALLDHDEAQGHPQPNLMMSFETKRDSRTSSPLSRPQYFQGALTKTLDKPSQEHSITRALNDLRSTLIDYWFSHVCQMWSTFDSDVNYKRQIATIYCTSSEVVFTTLQTMTAACLSSSVPSMREYFPSLESHAGTAIVRRLSRLQHAPAAVSREVATDLVFAALALGTSLHWARPSAHDGVLYTTARSLLARWESHAGNMDPLHLAFFRQALVYWEMLLSVSNAAFEHPSIELRRQALRGTARTETSMSDTPRILNLCAGPAALRGTRPHSSCGISSEVVDLFSQVVTLCRRAHQGKKTAKNTTVAQSEEVVCDLAMAQELQQELQALDFQKVVRTDERLGFPLHTGDDATPLAHHVQTAEAYRLAALLQLHLVFGDLAQCEPSITIVRQTTTHDHSISLSAQLLGILERVPPSSGLRCMQLVLYISAASGLRKTTPRPYGNDWTCKEVTRLRASILDRLELLRRALPARPVSKAVELINTMWTAYDAETGDGSEVHWLEFVQEERFRTLFC